MEAVVYSQDVESVDVFVLNTFQDPRHKIVHLGLGPAQVSRQRAHGEAVDHRDRVEIFHFLVYEVLVPLTSGPLTRPSNPAAGERQRECDFLHVHETSLFEHLPGVGACNWLVRSSFLHDIPPVVKDRIVR
jgi:hypothetical protein